MGGVTVIGYRTGRDCQENSLKLYLSRLDWLVIELPLSWRAAICTLGEVYKMLYFKSFSLRPQLGGSVCV